MVLPSTSSAAIFTKVINFKSKYCSCRRHFPNYSITDDVPLSSNPKSDQLQPVNVPFFDSSFLPLYSHSHRTFTLFFCSSPFFLSLSLSSPYSNSSLSPPLFHPTFLSLLSPFSFPSPTSLSPSLFSFLRNDSRSPLLDSSLTRRSRHRSVKESRQCNGHDRPHHRPLSTLGAETQQTSHGLLLAGGHLWKRENLLRENFL